MAFKKLIGKHVRADINQFVGAHGELLFDDTTLTLHASDGITPGGIALTGSSGGAGPRGLQGDIGPQGPQGIPGVKGDQGLPGATGLKGDTGLQGNPGKDGAPGVDGAPGLPGAKGDTGLQGIQGNVGIQGTPGINGLDAYQEALGFGFTGTLQEWLASLVGPQGIQGNIGLTPTIQVTSVFHVDSKRTDTYVETGSNITPFKTIQAAINAASGTSGTDIILAANNYTENIVINKNSLNIMGSGLAKLFGTIDITSAALITEFTDLTMKGNVTANLTGNCKINLYDTDANTGVWNITAVEGAGAGYFQIWGGSFTPSVATITGFNNGLIGVNGTNFANTITINNSWVQFNAASFWGSIVNLNNCEVYIGACGTDLGTTVNTNAGSTLYSDADFLGSITLINTGGTLINTTAKIVNPVPTLSIGKTGDVAGMTAVDATDLYYCTANYDGITAIWKKQALTGATW
jgi:hypothetical protein